MLQTELDPLASGSNFSFLHREGLSAFGNLAI
jgi:hypothetical protein